MHITKLEDHQRVIEFTKKAARYFLNNRLSDIYYEKLEPNALLAFLACPLNFFSVKPMADISSRKGKATKPSDLIWIVFA